MSAAQQSTRAEVEAAERAAYIQRIVAAAPPLTGERAARVARILNGGAHA